MTQNTPKLYRRLLLLLLLLAMATPVLAQTQADRLYNQGIRLQRTRTVRSQRSAITKFESAKQLYDSNINKKKCDDAIAVSNRTIEELRRPTSTYTEETRRDTTLRIALDSLHFDYGTHTASVAVTTSEPSWSAHLYAKDEGFVEVTTKTDKGCFEIDCKTNSTHSSRQQLIEIQAGNMRRIFTVVQDGKPTTLILSASVMEFSRKGGQKKIDVFANSTEVNTDNNGHNWKVLSKPDWVTVIGEAKTEKGLLGRFGDQVKDLFANAPVIAEDSTIINSVMSIIVSSKPKGSQSRTDEVVISSGNQQVKLVIHQK